MSRITELLKALKEKALDGYFTSSVANITYLTGFTGDSSRLFISANRCVLLTDGRYTEQARMECFEGIEILRWINDKRYASDTYKEVLNDKSIRRIAFEGNIITLSEYEILKASVTHAELVSETGMVEKLRQIKDTDEIECLRTAGEISDRALELTIPFIKPGITELEITAQLEFFLKQNGAENMSFDSLIISGARTSLLHGKPNTKKIESGDLVLFDFGALYKGYHADISRTFIMGKATEQQKEVYEIIRLAQENAVKSLKPGIASQVPDYEVRKVIPEKYNEYYYPGLGHGVGLQIHEEPFLGKAYEYTVPENAVVTIEPGIYIPGWGGLRIEDSVWVTAQGPVSLNNFPRELREI